VAFGDIASPGHPFVNTQSRPTLGSSAVVDLPKLALDVGADLVPVAIFGHRA